MSCELRRALFGICLLIAGCQKAAPTQRPEVAVENRTEQEVDALIDQASAEINAGRLNDAARILHRAVAMAEQRGEAVVQAARWLNRLASSYEDLGELPQAVAQLRLEVETLDRHPQEPGAQRSLFLALNYCGELLRGQEQFVEAEPLLLRALAVAQQHLRDEPLLLGTVLNNVGLLKTSQYKAAEAAVHFHQSLAAFDALSDHDERKRQRARVLANLAGLSRDQGKPKQALQQAQQALADAQAVYGTNDPARGTYFHAVAAMQLELEQLAEAAGNFEEARRLWRLQPSGHRAELAQVTEDLALVQKRLGFLSEAEALYREALTQLGQIYRRPHSAVGNCQMNLAELYRLTGEYERAESLFLQAAASLAGSVGENSLEYAVLLKNRAELYRDTGELVRARQSLERSLELRKKLQGAQSPAVATALNGLAQLRRDLEDFEGALALQREACALWKQAGGRIKEAVCHNNLAVTHMQGGDLRTAAAELLGAQSIFTAEVGAEAPELVQILISLADIHAAQGDLGGAEAELSRAQTLAAAAHGPASPLVATVLVEQAALRVRQGRSRESTPLLAQVMEIDEKQLRRIRTGPRLLALMEKLRGREEGIYSAVLDRPGDRAALRLALATALLRKGRALDEEAATEQILRRAARDPKLRALLRLQQELNARIDGLVWGSEAPSAERSRLKQQYEQMSEDLERQLVARAPRIGSALPGTSEIIARVAEQLPASTALVEIVTAAPYHYFAGPGKPRWGETHYLALVLRSDGATALVKLGTEREIDGAAAALGGSLRVRSRNPSVAAQRAYALTIGKLLPHLRGVNHLLISPDGALNLVPFAALHDGQDYLLKRYAISYLSSGRDLLRGASPPSTEPSSLFADPDFGDTGAASGPAPQIEKRGGRYQLIGSPPSLSGARTEVTQLAARLPSARSFVGKDATEAALLALRNPPLLHIATHGLFVNGSLGPPQKDSGERGAVALPPPLSAFRLPAPSEDPLSLSVLLLASAGRGGDPGAQEDGLVTAREAMSMELQGTQLVVLSACDSGLGNPRQGQGVYGLRRAFLAAGAETVVTSFWRLPDQQMPEFFDAYYDALARGSSRVDALREAALKMSRLRPHPYYWASLSSTGNYGPLRSVFPAH